MENAGKIPVFFIQRMDGVFSRGDFKIVCCMKTEIVWKLYVNFLDFEVHTIIQQVDHEKTSYFLLV